MIELILHTEKGQHRAFVPEGWNELEQGQIVQVADILFTEKADAFRRDISLARALSGLGWKVMFTVPHELIAAQILPLTNWVLEDCDLTTQLVPHVMMGTELLCGPKSHISNLRFGEFDAAERALHAWLQSPEDMSALCRFVAVLYRPMKAGYDIANDPDGDLREAYNENLCEARAARLLQCRMRPAIAYAIVLWYRGCRGYLMSCFPAVFSAPDANASEVAGEVAYFGLIRAIAKEGIYGTYADVEQMYLYTAFAEIDAARKDREALEAAMEEARQPVA